MDFRYPADTLLPVMLRFLGLILFLSTIALAEDLGPDDGWEQITTTDEKVMFIRNDPISGKSVCRRGSMTMTWTIPEERIQERRPVTAEELRKVEATMVAEEKAKTFQRRNRPLETGTGPQPMIKPAVAPASTGTPRSSTPAQRKADRTTGLRGAVRNS